MVEKKKEMRSDMNRAVRSIKTLDDLHANVMKQAGRNTVREREVLNIERDVNSVVDDQLQHLTRGRTDNTSSFIFNAVNDANKSSGKGTGNDPIAVNSVFDEQAESLYGMFKDSHQSANARFDDLESISKRMNDLEEAVMATRDAILTSDNLTATISRNLKFGSSDSITSKEDDRSRMDIIEDMEKRFKLAKKIRDHIVPKTLTYGRYYAYTIPYKTIFERHEYLKGMKGNGRSVTESAFVEDCFEGEDVKSLLESAVGVEHVKDSNVTEATIAMESILKSMHVSSDDSHVILEAAEINSLNALMDFKKTSKGTNDKKEVADGVGNYEDFEGIKDCHLKLIDPRRIVPVRIMDETIGYYHIHHQMSDVNSMNKAMCDRINIDMLRNGQNGTSDIEGSFITRIVDEVVKKFNRSYLEENIEFKKLIVDALMYDDTYRKQVQFQFIPVDYITEFKVNEDENGNGVSMLEPSLFYGKLYMSLLIFNMITIISKSGDQRVYYVKNSGNDKDITNQIQKVARSLKANQLNFNDLMAYSSMLSKVGKGKSMFIPVGESGERTLEFDTMAGQDVNLNSELMEDLKKSAVNSIGVPSVLSNYMNEADFAKTLVMANAKFLARVVMYQQDFNESLTELYVKLARFSTSLDESLVSRMEYSLAMPETLNTMNYSDLINNVDQLVAFFVKALTGEQASQEEIDNIIKDKFYKKVVVDYMKMFDWDKLEQMLADATVDAKAEEEKKKDAAEE